MWSEEVAQWQLLAPILHCMASYETSSERAFKRLYEKQGILDGYLRSKFRSLINTLRFSLRL